MQRQEPLQKSLLIAFVIQLLQISASVNGLTTGDGQPPSKAATFHFPEYHYKETSKNEIIFHELEVTCGQNVACEALPEHSVQRAACIRRCISRSCYEDIYAFDDWEEGEIDVRLNSYKGCVIQRENTKRTM